MFLRLASSSLVDRKGSVFLTVLAISVSIFVLLGIEHIRSEARESFSSTVSGTDLIVGARTSNINLLLYSVFRIGNATNNISWESYQEIASNPDVAWTIPIALGDSHRGYRVMGTSSDYFVHYSYGSSRNLTFRDGEAFEDLFDVVLGSEVAQQLDYSLGDELVLAHGMASTSFSNHDENPFHVVGVLEPTGTPVDQTLHVSLEAIEAIHLGWQGGIQMPGFGAATGIANASDLTPESITAFMLGLNSRMMTFGLQREINEYPGEPLMAILPGVTLAEFWQTLAVTESTMRLISSLVLVAALLGLSALLLASIRERQREIAILRTLGASPGYLFLLIELEATLITVVASALASILLYTTLLLSADYIVANFGLHIDANFLSKTNLILLFTVFVSSLLVCLIPAITAFRKALQ